MKTLETVTSIGGLEAFGYENGSYAVQVTAPDTLREAIAVIGKCSEDDVSIDAPEGAQSAVLSALVAAWSQNAKQGGKEKLRKAILEGDQDGVDKAVAELQESAYTYKMGASRGSAPGGVTKTKAGNVGKGLLDKLGPEALLALAAEHGIDLD